MNSDLVIEHLLATEGVILAREHPGLEGALRRRGQRDRLHRPLPGVFCDPAMAGDLRTRALAVSRWDPNAVITGRAAAALSFLPTIEVPTIAVASPSVHRTQAGFSFCERRVPPELVWRHKGVALTTPSLTAIELSTLNDTDVIDLVLRERHATLASLQEALRATPKRRGNRERWLVMIDSRAEPCSEAERLAHRIYRRAGITGWVTNLRVLVPDGDIYYLDIAFRRQRLVSEIDGFEHHTSRAVFETDRFRQNALLLDHWFMLRFTYLMLTDHEDYIVETTWRALGQRDRNWRLTGRNRPQKWRRSA